MFKIKVTEKSGAVCEYQSPVALNYSQLGHGKPERWVPASESHDPADVIAREMRVVVPAQTVVEQGPNGSVEKIIPPVEKEFVKLRAEYTVEVIDITYQAQLAECLAKRKAEYPTPEEFLDAFFDGDASTLAAIRAKRLAIKEKYKKPV